MNPILNKPSYSEVLGDLKKKIQIARCNSLITVNQHLLSVYWEIGNTILHHQFEEGWGTKVIDRLSADLRREFPEMKGFSVRNIKNMRAFAKAYPDFPIVKAPLAQLQHNDIECIEIVQAPPAQLKGKDKISNMLAQISWYHHVLILDRVKDKEAREFYIIKTIQNGWSCNVLSAQIESKLHLRMGGAISNFNLTVPSDISDLARETFKNPYLLDFIDIQKEIHERDLERALIQNLKQLLLELGRGFAYVGNQVRFQVEKDEFFLDLLFFNFSLNCFVVFELKVGDFKPEYAGKLSFYITCIDNQLKGRDHKPTIGVLLCKTPNKTVVKYTLQKLGSPMGVAEYELKKSLPKKLLKQMPTREELEEQFRSIPEVL